MYKPVLGEMRIAEGVLARNLTYGKDGGVAI